MDVVVIGGGMAGLMAAREMARAGLRVMLVEARPHVGGRVQSQRAAGETVELGAEFIHGRPPELWGLIEEFGLDTVEREGAMLREVPPGEPAEESGEADESNGGPFDSLGVLAELEPDRSFATWLAEQRMPAAQTAALTGYVEGFNAADAARISARSLGVQQRAEEQDEGDRAWHVVGGYGQVAERLRQQLLGLNVEVRLDEAVRSLRWGAEGVEIQTTRALLRARTAVVALPLGVLHRVNAPGGVEMNPEPAAIAQARRMAMGDALHVSLVFESRWWEEVPQPATLEGGPVAEAHFLFSRERRIPVWWTTFPERPPVLVGWAGGPRARPLQVLDDAALAELACRELAGIFGVGEGFVSERLLRIVHHDWTADPLSLGAYSYVAAGALDAPGRMTEPEAGRIFFAGEHTDTTGHWGTVHAALRSGVRVAGQVVEALR